MRLTRLYLTNLSKFDCNFNVSIEDLIIENILTSLTNKIISTVLTKIEIKSFINNMNKKGPK